DVVAFLDEEIFEPTEQATVKIRKGKGHVLRQSSTVISSDDEYDLCRISFNSRESFLDVILWHGEDAVIIEPTQLRDAVIERLRRLVASHG
ncbi:MAG TPA: WYL domain-containing protein, partial [Candidatus Nanopelagicaceae bacterium]